MGLDQAAGRLTRSHTELQDAVGWEGDRSHRLFLQLVIAGQLGTNPLEVDLWCPVELAHLVISS